MNLHESSQCKEEEQSCQSDEQIHHFDYLKFTTLASFQLSGNHIDDSVDLYKEWPQSFDGHHGQNDHSDGKGELKSLEK